MAPVRKAIRTAAGKGKAGGSIEQEVYENMVDVLASWALLAGLTCSVPYINFMVGKLCSGSSETLLTFSCVDSIVFSYIWCMICSFCFILPDASNNPWDTLYVSGHTIRRKAVRFGLQMGAAAAFAVALQHANEQLAKDVYSGAMPRVNLCRHPTATAYHASLMKGKKCYEEWPALTDDGLEMGVIFNEAAHTFVLNVALGLVLPYAGSYWRLVVPSVIVAVLRSPFCTTGPAMNMVPGTAGAVLHGGLDALRVHLIGSGLGKFLSVAFLTRAGAMAAWARGLLGGGHKVGVEDLSWAESKKPKKKVA